MSRKKLQIIHDSKDQGSTLRSKDLKIQELTCFNTTCTFLDPLKHKLFNLVIYPSDYLDKLFRSRLIQSNHIM